MALGDIDRHFAWLAWRFWHWTGSGGALGSPLDAVVAAAVGVAGVALGDIDRRFAWQAWPLVTSTVTLRGRRETYGTGLALVAHLGLRVDAIVAAAVGVAGVALGDVDRPGRRGTW